MVKKIVALFMALAVLAATATGCSKANNTGSSSSETASVSSTQAQGLQPIAKDKLKVGFIYIGKVNDGGYNQAHDTGRKALEKEGIACEIKEDVPETNACETAINELIGKGCNVIYTTSFGHGEWTAKAAKANPTVYFGHATGEELDTNLCNYMGRVEEARYLTGIVAGLKTKTNKIGYVAAMPYSECIRGINAFTLGVQSVNKSAKVKVLFTNTWFDIAKETSAAKELLNAGCDVLAQHQDSTACQLTAEKAGAFAIGYNTSTPKVAPKAYLTAALFHWDKFYTDNVHAIIDGTWKSTSYWEGLKSGWVSVDALSSLCPADAKAKVEAAQAQIISGDLKLFSGEIKDQTGAVKGKDMTDSEIYHMTWFVQGVEGSTK